MPPPTSAEIDDDDAQEETTPVVADAEAAAPSKMDESIAVRGKNSYYYAWVQTNKQRQKDGLAPMPPPPPPKIPTPGATALVPVEKMPNTQLVSRGFGEDWVDPPPPGGWMVAMPAPVYTEEQLFNRLNWLSPPRGWPYVAGPDGLPIIKEFIGKKLAGKRVRLTEPPHPMELERMSELNAALSPKDAKANAVLARRLLGWEVVGGFALLELAQGTDRKEIPDKPPVYHGEKHWWNVTPKGLWVDFTVRASSTQRRRGRAAMHALP